MDPAVPAWLAPAIAGVMGLAVGSFLNVVIHRIPAGASIVKPSSRCPSCGMALAWYDNIPLVSFAVLRGRCRGCGEKIGWQYPIVETANAAGWATLAAHLGWVAELPMFLMFFSVLLVLSAIDLAHKKIPNKILWPASLAALGSAAATALVSGSGQQIPGSAAGALAYGGAILAIALVAPGGMGGGDIKLAGYIGWHSGWLGLGHVAVAAFAGVLIGGLTGIGLLATGLKGRKDALPFGPAMAAGALVAIFFGNRLLEAWLG